VHPKRKILSPATEESRDKAITSSFSITPSFNRLSSSVILGFTVIRQYFICLFDGCCVVRQACL
jgi:hypothetical protein